MKKTIFVGKVNDQEFDNVNDYNACVQALLDSGEDFQATSSTQMVEVPNEEKTEVVEANPNDRPLKAVATYLPGVDKIATGEYIDENLISDDDDFQDRYNAIEDELREVFASITEAIPYNSSEQLGVYNKSVKNLLDKLNIDYKKNLDALTLVKNKIDELEPKLEELYNTADLLEKAEAIINLYTLFYNEIDKRTCGGECKCKNCECDKCNGDAGDAEGTAEVTWADVHDKVKKLFETIFGS